MSVEIKSVDKFYLYFSFYLTRPLSVLFSNKQDNFLKNSTGLKVTRYQFPNMNRKSNDQKKKKYVMKGNSTTLQYVFTYKHL